MDQMAKDCLTCRVIGTATFAGASGYMLWERTKIPLTKPAHRHTLLGLSVLFGGLAIARAVTGNDELLRPSNASSKKEAGDQ